ncbi:hypothetical protein [Deinococcus marmoris]|uniref:hypothetical protein n=1 Tax=Deinococcus marmoris TaxID=249408 RepID=UPI0004952358|nr:hypothetical protein [Deinococcus marmoris]
MLRLLGMLTLGYVLASSLVGIGMNTVSISYGPQTLRPFLFEFHIFPDINLTPSFLLPILLIALLMRAGISAWWASLVPICGSQIGTIIASVMTINVPLNFTGNESTVLVDLMPSGLSSAADLLLTLGINVLAVLLGICLGQLLRRRQQRTPA